MRTNLPVTQKEYQFPADQTLISVTDLKGRITYCNGNFVTVSGYQRDEPDHSRCLQWRGGHCLGS